MADNTKRESILARLRALTMRTTANGCTEAEAKEAAAKIDELLEQYELTLDDVTIRTEAEIVKSTITGIGRSSVTFVGKAVGTFTDTELWLENDLSDVVILGIEVDVEIAEYLMQLFHRAIERECATWTMMDPLYTMTAREDRRDVKKSFEVGVAARLSERLRELKSKRDFTAKAGGRDLVLAKRPLIDAAMKQLGIELGAGKKARSVRHEGAYNAGREAGNRVNIHQGVRGRAASAGSIR
jgi:hypothetical protein